MLDVKPMTRHWQRRQRWTRLVGVRLSEDQASNLEAIAERSGLPVSELVRAAVDALLVKARSNGTAVAADG